MSTLRIQELRRQIKEYLDVGIIERSAEAHVSHVHMTKKQDTTELRFTCDYRQLNDTMEGDNWPIPNIKSLFQQLGEKKAKIYGSVRFN